ncbi:MAG: asparagine synthase (glutamine-hydrolyzing), partial [Deltaproteobacteria bacterium]|nr:asparagine synthase (glutamine-hydrolyzing) [Deltaproteobacteria bacterium]
AQRRGRPGATREQPAMCGICGIVQRAEAAPVDARVLHAMMDAMTHRGPDQDGAYLTPQVGLGSRRLSIIDLAGGRQPIANEDASLHIVLNGEIYNYRELRAFLTQKGHRFTTHTDTEVVLHLYEELDAAALDHLNGIFAFAIWDARTRALVLARDRMGVKPLYFAETRDGLAFGSEMKVLLQHPEVERRLDPVALNEYLSYEFVPTPRTIFQHVRRLPPAHCLTWSARGLTLTEYWRPSLKRSESHSPVHWREFAGGLREALRSSVERELVSDVPIGVLLSGGIDSSVVTALMARAAGGTVDSFSVAYDEPSFDESRYARLVAQHVGTRHHELRLTSQMAAEAVPQIAEVLDEPLGDASFVPTLLLSRFARQHVKVVLGGDGSDEILAGYPTLGAHRLIEYYETVVPWHVRTWVAQKLLTHLPVSFDYFSRDFKIRRFVAGRGVPFEVRHHRWMGSFTDEEKAELFQDWVKPVLGDTYARTWEHSRDCDARLPLNRILYDDMKLYLEGDILFKVDRASMAASLEVRVPFLNRIVVDYASALPIELKLRRLTGKYLLRRAVGDLLPAEVVKRPKQGFAMPVAHWLGGPLRELVGDLLSPARIRRQGLFNDRVVSRLVDAHFARTSDNRKQLWTLLIFQLWHARWAAAPSG